MECLLYPNVVFLLVYVVSLQEFETRWWFCVNCLMSGGPFSPFENSWHLKAEYRNPQKKQELADQFVVILFLWNILL